jgi:hypothetical protein
VALIETNYTSIADAAAMYAFKGDMVAQGWAVAISSDGTTYNGAGDQISSSGSGAGGIDNANVYFLLRRTGAPDFLFERGGDSSTWTIYFSESAAFAGGDATSRPTAGDERVGFDGGSWALFQTTTLASVDVAVEDASPYRWGLRSVGGGGEDVFAASIGATAAHPIVVQNIAFSGGVFYAESDAEAWADVTDMIGVAVGGGGGGGGDTTDPVIENFDPADASSIVRADTIAVDVSDETALESVVITAELADGTVLAAYSGGAFVGAFAAGSTLVGDTYTIEYDAPGWPSSSVTIHVSAVDTSGNSATASASYTVTDPPAPADTDEPTVTLVSPAEDSEITRATAIVIDVTDASSFAAIFVWVVYPNGSTDVVHDGEGFAVPFAGSSTRTSISGGYRYTLRRAGGWPAAPTVRVRPVDTAGNTP